VEENNLMPIFREYGLDESDVQFIKELILGDPSEGPAGFEWKGRGDKTFLYDIVANKRNGIDVDRFDYFNRDCHVLGVTKSFDDTRLMEFARYRDDFTNAAFFLFLTGVAVPSLQPTRSLFTDLN
jgi:hypothetical protein